MVSKLPTVVLLYHRIAFEPPDPNGLQVRPEHFAAQLTWLRERADLVPLDEIDRPTGSRPRVVVTIDDGYVDNLMTAKPILERFGVPATVFVTSGLVGSRRGFWQDRLIDLLLRGEPASEHIEVEIGGRVLRAHIGSPAGRERTHRFLHQRLRRRPPAERDRVLAELEHQVGRPSSVPASSLPLSADELRRLVDGRLVTLGAHTVHHAMLSALDEREQEVEMAQSVMDLRAVVGTPVESFAYPFGRTGEFDAKSVQIARRLFVRALTSEPGVAAADADPHLIPRVYVGDWEIDQFARRVRPFFL